MLYTDNRLRLREDIVLDSFVINRAGGTDSLAVFLDLLNDFAIQSSFNKFYHKHKDYYLTIIDTTIDNLGNQNYISELEAFYSKRQKSYNIILVSLYNFVGFGNSLLYTDDKRDLYNTMGPMKVENNVPFFGDENYLKYMIRHEFSHPFINPADRMSLNSHYCYEYGMRKPGALSRYLHRDKTVIPSTREKRRTERMEQANAFL